jgi:hypothetical protein
MNRSLNLRELFTLYPFSFESFGPWVKHHKAMHAKHPLDCPEFGAEWLRRWEAVGRLLEMPAFIESNLRRGAWYQLEGPESVTKSIQWVVTVAPFDMRDFKKHKKRRIVLLDGTIVKEWGAK